ncbi:hypothetical protein WA1_21760 [Scytonema hofmannii PCC 7110]|uniref:Uncharacterized protein n=1 Tax=Scytonema hofmannii PCC 7110 TaxID=128403 RepID=A0A139X9G2_9CYAN|nr:hypothetical protein [Scytonema hofmannii]KYC41337.1 hypothetical protein WA1_21760 [Scytonema hofmannii PCC 7110]
MKKLGLPIWLPCPSAWLNALILSVFMAGLGAFIRRSGLLDSYLDKWSQQPELSSVMLILLLVSPIPAIAFFHHFFLSRFIPAIPGERVKTPEGLVPGIISWRESLYSWLVFVLSTLIAALICIPFLSLFKVNYEKIIYTYNQPHRTVQILFAVVWIISAALLYQVEYLFKDRLLFMDDFISEEPSVSQEQTVDIQPENQQAEAIATQIPITEISPQKKTNITDLIVKYRKLPQRIFTLLLISVAGLWMYFFANLPKVKQTVSANLSYIEKQLAVPSETAPPEDSTYQKGLNKAKSATRLTKSAQSESEWRVVSRRWEEAIKHMEGVPTSSPNYALAQQKILQYQLHREFAKQMLSNKQ